MTRLPSRGRGLRRPVSWTLRRRATGIGTAGGADHHRVTVETRPVRVAAGRRYGSRDGNSDRGRGPARRARGPAARPSPGLAAAAPAARRRGRGPAAGARQRPRRELRRGGRRAAGPAHPARRVVVVPVGCGLPGLVRCRAGRRRLRRHRSVGAHAHGRAADRAPDPHRPGLRRAAPSRRTGKRGRRVPAAGVRAAVRERRRALRPAAVGDHRGRAGGLAHRAGRGGPCAALAGRQRLRRRVRGLPRPVHPADDARGRGGRPLARGRPFPGAGGRSARSCSARPRASR